MDTYICDQCEKSFSRKNNLTRHMRNAHEKITFSCDKCGKDFTRDNARKQHNVVCTGNSSQGGDQGGVCDICGKFFARMDTLRRHKQNVHDGVKHKCSKCAKTYARNCDRVKHETTCAPVRATYTCAHCPTTFKSVEELRAHGKQPHRKRAATESVANSSAAKQKKQAGLQCRRCVEHFPVGGSYTPITWLSTINAATVPFKTHRGAKILRHGMKKTAGSMES